MPKILVTDAGSRNTVAVVRSLGRAGLDVVTSDLSRVAMCRFSRYVKGHRVYPCPSTRPDEWIPWLVKELSGGKYAMVLPMDDDTVGLCARNKERLSEFTRVPVPEYPTFLKAQDKSSTIRLAREIGIPAPETVFPSSGKEALQMASGLTFPLIIKPRFSSGSRGIACVRRPEELEEAFERVHGRYPFPLVQEWIPPGGEACGVFALFTGDHRPVATFCHRRIRSYPVEGGPSTLRESFRFPDLISQGVRLLREMDWYGVAMVEFLQDPRDGIYKLMEINPRFWGSLQLSICAGVDFPWLLYQVAMGKEPEFLDTWEAGIQCRWLLPGDILHFLFNPRRFQMKPGFFHCDSKTSDDFLSLRDPGPTLGFFLMLFRYVFSWEKWQYVFRR